MPKSQKKHRDGHIADNGHTTETPKMDEGPVSQEVRDAASSGAEAEKMNMEPTSVNQPKERETPDVAVLAQDLEKARQQAAENFDGWQRERADFLNYKKRIERDQSQMSANITGDVIKRYLVILDDLERALKARPTNGEGAKWAEGIELIYRKLQNILDAEGITRIPAEQENFDPSRHEAITHEDSPDHQSGDIIEVVQQGYKIGDRILRPALVRVAR